MQNFKQVLNNHFYSIWKPLFNINYSWGKAIQVLSFILVNDKHRNSYKFYDWIKKGYKSILILNSTLNENTLKLLNKTWFEKVWGFQIICAHI